MTPDQEARAAFEALKPCPFCGAQPTDHAIEPHSHGLVLNGVKLPDHPGSHVIECACGAGLIADTFAEVAAMWNRRSGEEWQRQSAGADAGTESLETSEQDAVEPHPCAHGCRYALNGEGLAPQCIVGCRRAMRGGKKR